MKKLWSVLAGLAVSILVIIFTEKVSHSVHSPPAGLDFKDLEQVKAYMGQLPPLVLLIVALGHFLGLLSGAIMCYKIAKTQASVNLVTLIFSALVLMNLYLIPHPIWFVVADISAVLLAYLISRRILK